MPNRTSTAFVNMAAMMLTMCGLCCLGIGLSGALAPEEMVTWMRYLMWGLAISGALLIYGGIDMILAAKRKEKEIDKDEKQLKQEVLKPVNLEEAVKSVREAGTKLLPDKNTLLAHWVYNADEWKEYTRKEFRYRVREAFFLLVLITGIGTWLVSSYRDMGYHHAFWASFLTGLLFTVIRLAIAYNARTANSGKPGDVIISAKSIIINGKYHILNDEKKTTSQLDFLKDETPKILEFTVVWNVRNGTTNEQVRIPVPAGKEDEAETLVFLFRNEIIGKY